MNPQINKNTRDIAEIFRRLEIDIEQPEIPTGTTVSGSGAANRVAYWTAASVLGSDAGLQVDATNDLYIVADGGGIGASNTDVRTLYDTTNGRIDAILGDAAGADEFRIVDSAGTAVATVDSDGAGYFAERVGVGVSGDATQLTTRAAAGSNASWRQKDADVNSPFRQLNPQTDAETHLQMGPVGSDDGGAFLAGFTDTDQIAVALSGYVGSTTPTSPAIQLRGLKTNGGTGTASLADTERVLTIQNVATDILTVYGNGDTELGGVLVLGEVSAPTVAADQMAIYGADNGGTTELIAEFNSGDTVVLAREPRRAMDCKNGL